MNGLSPSEDSHIQPTAPHAAESRSARWPILLILALGLITATWLGNDFGMSWDEYRNVKVGQDALRLLSGSRDYFSNESLADHGPVYFMIFSAGSKAIARLLPGWTEADGRHVINFLTFLVAVASFYSISRRVVRPPYDWMVTALFATQPLLFGYGFIAQKDIPFLAGFLATLATGLAAVEAWRNPRAAGPAGGEPRAFFSSLRDEWRRRSAVTRVVLVLLGLASLALLADLLIFGVLHRFGASILEAAYSGSAPGLVQRLFDRLAVDAYKTTLDAYAAKYETLFANLKAAGIVLFSLIPVIALSAALPTFRRGWGLSRDLAAAPYWIASAVLLGATICIRQVGAFVGLLVSLAALRRGRNRALFPLAVYWLLAAVVTLVTWPYLWADPIHRIFESLQLAATFSRHSTIFRGVRVASGELPWDYFPTLTALQLTETAVALVVAGLLIGVVLWVRGDRRRFLIGVLFLWFAVPLALLITLHTAGYEFRHFLFMLPPLLILGGLALQAIGERLRAGWLRGLLFIVAILPGMIGIIRLHPYEYIYFNSLAGGVSGADGRFQLERECLSYREGIQAVNRIAAPGAVVIVPQQTNQVEPFARADLILRDAAQGYADADFVLSCTWRDAGDWRTGGFERVFEVRRGAAVLMSVWQRAKAP